jgi:hypothetical protein
MRGDDRPPGPSAGLREEMGRLVLTSLAVEDEMKSLVQRSSGGALARLLQLRWRPSPRGTPNALCWARAAGKRGGSPGRSPSWARCSLGSACRPIRIRERRDLDRAIYRGGLGVERRLILRLHDRARALNGAHRVVAVRLGALARLGPSDPGGPLGPERESPIAPGGPAAGSILGHPAFGELLELVQRFEGAGPPDSGGSSGAVGGTARPSLHGSRKGSAARGIPDELLSRVHLRVSEIDRRAVRALAQAPPVP